MEAILRRPKGNLPLMRTDKTDASESNVYPENDVSFHIFQEGSGDLEQIGTREKKPRTFRASDVLS